MSDASHPKSSPWFLLLLVAFCLLWFYALGARTLVPTDEGRYAEMAREMVATGNWVTPRLNGIKYFEKPPLQTWMNALSFQAFGLGEWQARLWTGLCGLFGIVLTWQAGRKVFGERIGLAAGLVLASSFWWAAFGHVNTLDMGLSGMMTLALCGLLLGQRAGATLRESRNWMLACWAGMALAVLSKGLIGVVLPGAVLVLYTCASRDWAIWKRLHAGLGLLVFFAIVTPWFVLVSLENPEFPHFFFIHEHFQRFTSKIHRRAGPLYYFIPLLVIGILPWLGMLMQSLWAARREVAGGLSDDKSSNNFQPRKMLLIWAAFIFFFFSISGSKLPSYILPIFPALALLIAVHAEAASRLSWMLTAGLMGLLGIAGLAFVPMLPGLATDAVETASYVSAQPWAYLGLSILLACAGYVLWLTRQGPDDMAMRATMALAIAGFVAGQLLMLGSESYGRDRSGLPLVPAIQAELSPDVKLYAVGLYDQTLPFYLRRTMTLVGHADELEFGLTQEPNLWLPTREAFASEWSNGKKAVAITRPEIFSILQKQGLPMRVITRDSRRVVITNAISAANSADGGQPAK